MVGESRQHQVHSYVCNVRSVRMQRKCTYERRANYGFVSVASACACKNGVTLPGVDCSNGVVVCAACNNGFTMNDARDACVRKFFCVLIKATIANRKQHILRSFVADVVANVCACANGVPETGATCAMNGAAKCKACNPGWTINRAKTACTCACAGAVLFCTTVLLETRVCHW